jgi:hypothetical protein
MLDLANFVKPTDESSYLYLIERYATHLHEAVAKAILGTGILPKEILELEGMSSNGIRLFLNNLCQASGHYLEIGSWKGSTFISAMYNNPIHGTSVDHHQEFKGCSFESTSEILKSNCENHLVNGEHYDLISADCFAMPLPELPVDIYLYDGWHSYDAQYNALKYYYDSLKPFFFFICDDYSIDRVEQGTQDALRDLDIQVISEFKLFGNQILPASTKSGFWNGYYAAFCVKKKEFPEFFRKEKYTHCFDSN